MRAKLREVLDGVVAWLGEIRARYLTDLRSTSERVVERMEEIHEERMKEIDAYIAGSQGAGLDRKVWPVGARGPQDRIPNEGLEEVV